MSLKKMNAHALKQFLNLKVKLKMKMMFSQILRKNLQRKSH
jgi:hypothetical protein